MADKFYYLVASLPYLSIDEDPKITMNDFLQEASKWLSDEEKKILVSLEDNKSQTEVIAMWNSFFEEIQKEAVLTRQSRRDNKNIKEGKYSERIFSQKTPLEMEKQLERIKWEYIDSIEAKYNFDLNRLVCYCLKLKIIERIKKFNKEKGEIKFYNLCEVKI